MQKTGRNDSETLKNELHKVKNYKGVSGLLTVDKNGDVHRPLQLMIVKDNTLVPYAK